MKLRYLFTAVALAAGTPAIAGDDVVTLGRYQPPAGGFAGAVQTAAAKETADLDDDEDTVLIHGRRYARRYGGVSFGFYGGGYRTSFAYYSPRHYGRSYYSSYYRPYYSSYYSRPYYSSYPVVTYWPTYYASSYPVASVVTAPAQTPTIINNYYYSTPAPSTALTPPRPMIPPSDTAPKYDGGPMNPVPQPMPDAKPVVPSNNANVKISGTKPATKYPAYGEK